MNTTINSAPVPLYQTFAYAIQVVFTGTPTGTFSLQGSCDPIPQARVEEIVPTNWSTIINSSISVSAAGNLMWNVAEIGYNYVRVVYTDTSGGTSTAIITAANFNGKGM
jgi:hypothetical protein